MKISNDFEDDDDYLAGFYESKMSYYEKCVNDNMKKNNMSLS